MPIGRVFKFRPADLRCFDKPPDRIGLVPLGVEQNFDCQISPEIGVTPLDDRSHAAPSDLALQLITTVALMIEISGEPGREMGSTPSVFGSRNDT